MTASTRYNKTREYLIDMGVDSEVIQQLDQLGSRDQERIAKTFSEVVEDEILYVLAVHKKDSFKQYLSDQYEKLEKSNAGKKPTSNMKVIPLTALKQI